MPQRDNRFTSLEKSYLYCNFGEFSKIIGNNTCKTFSNLIPVENNAEATFEVFCITSDLYLATVCLQ